MSSSTPIRILPALSLIACLSWDRAGAQDVETVAENTEAVATGDGTQSGFDDIPQFGGPEGVSAELARNDQLREGKFQFQGMQRAFAPYFDWKRFLNDEYGVSFGLQYYLLPQFATRSQGDKGALGDIFRFNGTWTLFGRDGHNPGRIEWRFESRSGVLGAQSPMELSADVGAAALATGFPYTDNFEMDLAVLNWTQGFRDSTTGLAAGRLAFDVYLDAMPFQTTAGGFLNRSFVLNPTIPTTGIGALGVVGKGFVNKNFWVGGHLYDANAVNGKFDWDTIREGEFITAIEGGWTPGFDNRKSQMVQLTIWHKDSRSIAGTPSGSGWAVSTAWRLNERFFPFLRFGHSDGGGGVAAESAASAGIEIKRTFDESFVFGVGWAKPSEKTHGPGLRDEWVIEASYKFQLARNFSLTPDIQLLLDPANNPNESSSLVIGVRAIFTL